MSVERRAIIKIIGMFFFGNSLALAKKSTNIKFYDYKCSDINELRTLKIIEAGRYVMLTEYHKGSGIGGGVFKLDINDIESQDDCGSCIINSSNQRLKRLCPNNIIRASDYGITGGSEDSARLFSYFLGSDFDKYIDVNVFTSEPGKMKDGTNLTAKEGCVVNALNSINQKKHRNNQGQTIEIGNNCTVKNVEINGNGFGNNGFLVYKKENVTIENCKAGNGTGQCILDVFSKKTCYKSNHLYDALHGIQYWGSRSSISANNHVHNVTGGIWSACASELIIKNNYIHDCYDVGIDFEGGNHCLSDSNKVEYCSNGELAIFGTGKQFFKSKIPMGNLSHKNNVVKRRGYYFDRAGKKIRNNYNDLGACSIFGNIDKNVIGPIIFEGNQITIESGDGYSARCFASRPNSDSDMNLYFLNNSFLSFTGEIGVLLSSNRVIFEGNLFKILGAYTKGSVIKVSEVNKLLFKDNFFEYKIFNSEDTPAMIIKGGEKSQVLFEGNNFSSGSQNLIEVQVDKSKPKVHMFKNIINNHYGCDSSYFGKVCGSNNIYFKVTYP
ncbi:right-handed parallel beta-helix repeat-containing protein [Erwiniaceae bacterium CAU 1747]